MSPCLLLFLPAAVINEDSLTKSRIGLAGHKVVLTIDDGYRSVYDYVYPLLKKYRMTATLGIIVNYLTDNKTGYGNPGSFLNYWQVREMMDSINIEIASHSLSHPWLTRLDSARAWDEIYRSKLILESLFGVPVITFIYPYGDLNNRVVRMVRRAGYRLARAVRSGAVNFWVDPYRLPEFELRRETGLEAVKAHIRQNPVTVLLLHRIVPWPSVFTEWPVDSFAALIKWMADNQVRTMTLAELYARWQQELIGRLIKEREIIDTVLPPDLLFKNVNIDNTRTFQPR
ncbi:MAG: polysaccharide deacetylase family protein [candidate division WOR-3 bacterium]|jgi:peptidoglycan/xylan/chitin deacetylase (PgdA/CDA1 family)